MTKHTTSEEQQFLDDLDMKLWNATDRLRSNLYAAVYKHAVLGLIFLKYVSEALDLRREELAAAFRDPKSNYFSGRRHSACSTALFVARPCSQSSQEHLFALFTSNRVSTANSTLITGTTGSHQRIKAEAGQSSDTVIPPGRFVTNFARQLFARINHNAAESRTLATLRDTLLPKLLSGGLSTHHAPN